MPALLVLLGGGFLAMLGTLVGIVGWFAAARKRVPIRAGMVGLAIVAGLALSGFLVATALSAFKVPPIHEISTDLQEPPPFVAARAARERVPNVNSSDYVADQKAGGPRGAVNVPDVQRKFYPDIQPLMLEIPVAEAFARVERAVAGFGWEVHESAPAEGRLEAVDTTFFFGFKDDVVVRVRSENGGSRIDVRSKSRVGLGDAGANAKRVRALLAAVRRG
jgi:uncharacterized protein (DUF1499 family)